jgi:hypothetical protein
MGWGLEGKCRPSNILNCRSGAEISKVKDNKLSIIFWDNASEEIDSEREKSKYSLSIQ